MGEQIIFLVSAVMGSLAHEASHWFELRYQLERSAYQKVLKSPQYWAIVILMFIISSAFPYIWFWSRVNIDPRDYFLSALSAPLLIRKGVGITRSSRGVEFGSAEREISSALRQYFAA